MMSVRILSYGGIGQVAKTAMGIFTPADVELSGHGNFLAMSNRPEKSTAPRLRPRHILFLGIGVAMLALAGCSGSDDAAVAIEPIEPILASGIDVVIDPSGTTGTVEVDTTIPVACAIIYGTDGSFGSIAVDNDMQGGAHQDHGPLLTDLVPDTEYQYILQGSDTEGRIYRSETMTFRTPPAADTTDSGLPENLAATATVTGASSEFSAGFAATNAIDGNLSTEWSTAGDGDDAWIEIDLGESREITSVAFRTRQMTDGTAITESFTVTIDGTTLGPFPVGTEAAVLDEPTTGQVIRVDAATTTGGNTGATEIEIFGS
jgi:F5/8 type C domain-containing protein